MRMWGNRKQRLASSVALAALVLILPACGGGGGGGGGGTPSVTASFTSNDGASASNLVRFSGSSCTNDNCTLTVAIGPTTASDYYAFAFDILISDATVARFVPGSDSAGAFLTGTVDSVVSQSGDRVVVGVSKQGAVAGNGTASEATVLTLNFQALKTGSANLTFVGSPSNPNLPNCGATSPEALDSNGDCIASTVFGAGGSFSGS